MTTKLTFLVGEYGLSVDARDASSDVPSSYWLLEDGGYYLQEFGSRIILEESIPVLVLLEDGESHWLQEDGGRIIAELKAAGSYRPILLNADANDYRLSA